MEPKWSMTKPVSRHRQFHLPETRGRDIETLVKQIWLGINLQQYSMVRFKVNLRDATVWCVEKEYIPPSKTNALLKRVLSSSASRCRFSLFETVQSELVRIPTWNIFHWWSGISNSPIRSIYYGTKRSAWNQILTFHSTCEIVRQYILK